MGGSKLDALSDLRTDGNWTEGVTEAMAFRAVVPLSRGASGLGKGDGSSSSSKPNPPSETSSLSSKTAQMSEFRSTLASVVTGLVSPVEMGGAGMVQMVEKSTEEKKG